MYQLIVTELRKKIGFDREIIDQFNAEYGGEVVAEDHLESLSPLLGHYPDSDIPQLANDFSDC
jgi:two-component system, chemotaxis family, sensor kinase Cph1